MNLDNRYRVTRFPDPDDDLHPFAAWFEENEDDDPECVEEMTAEQMLQYRIDKEGCQRLV